LVKTVIIPQVFPEENAIYAKMTQFSLMWQKYPMFVPDLPLAFEHGRLRPEGNVRLLEPGCAWFSSRLSIKQQIDHKGLCLKDLDGGYPLKELDNLCQSIN
jgi:hypothetical protein